MMGLLDCTCEPLGGIHEAGCVSQRLRRENLAPDAQQPTQEPSAGPEPGNEPSGATGAPQTAGNPHEPPAHVLAAGAYAASFRERDPLEARAADLPADWRAVVQHSAKTPEEKARYHAHREALGVFLGLLVSIEAQKCGLGVPGLPPVESAFGLDVQKAEIEVVAAALYLDDVTGTVGRFPAALAMWCCVQVTRWIRLAKAQQVAGPRLARPGDADFNLNRATRRAR